MGMKEIKTKEDLDLELVSGGNKFLLFYSAWCPFCIEFTPAFEKLAANNPASFCKVSTDTVPEAEQAFSIDVVPTVLFFRGGKLERRLDGIVNKGLSPEGLAEFVWLCRGSGKGF